MNNFDKHGGLDGGPYFGCRFDEMSMLRIFLMTHIECKKGPSHMSLSL